MWGDNNPFDKTGGGFMAGATDSPAPGEKQGKGKRSQNVMPVTIKQLLECQEDAFSLEGFEAQVITVVGLVTKVETSTTKISMWLDDQTGSIECVNYTGTDENTGTPPVVLCESTYGRIVGALRKARDAKYMIIFKATHVTDLNELNCHLLEVIQTGITLKRLREAEERKIATGGQFENTFSNSMIKPGLGGPTGFGGATGSSSTGGIQGFTPNQNIVHRVLSSCRDEQGMHRDNIIAAVKSQIPMREISDILEFLSNEGHIFTTVDDDHFKATDSQYM